MMTCSFKNNLQITNLLKKIVKRRSHMSLLKCQNSQKRRKKKNISKNKIMIRILMKTMAKISRKKLKNYHQRK